MAVSTPSIKATGNRPYKPYQTNPKTMTNSIDKKQPTYRKHCAKCAAPIPIPSWKLCNDCSTYKPVDKPQKFIL